MTRNFGFSGSATALATPFHHGLVDVACMERLCGRQITRGTTTLVVCGSTGEAAALTMQEQSMLVRLAVATAAGRVPVMAGCTACNTDAAMELASAVTLAGANALLCTPPPYVRPTQEGIMAHVRGVAHTSDLPILIYDVPGRTGVAITDETVAQLFERNLIVGIKDATADRPRPTRLGALCGSDLVQMSGDDGSAADYRAAGGHGCISVTANVAPALCSLLHRSWGSGDLVTFACCRDLLTSLNEALFTESNSIALKAALAHLGLAEDELRLPLTPANLGIRSGIAAALVRMGSAEEALAARSPHAFVN